MAYIVVADIVMAHTVTGYVGPAYIVVACIVMECDRVNLKPAVLGWSAGGSRNRPIFRRSSEK